MQKILIVEDDPDIRENLAYALTEEGYTVVEAENGQVALDYLTSTPKENIPGCIILDLMMPVMNGAEFLRVLHTGMLDLPTIKIIIVTAAGDAAFVESLEGAVEKLKKPLDLGRLFEVIEHHCGKPA